MSGDAAMNAANSSANMLPRIATIALAVTPRGLLTRIIYFHIESLAGDMASVQVRYIVRDTDLAIAFYTTHLGFELKMHPRR